MSKQWPVLYVKTSSGQINFWMIWTEGARVHMQWGKVGTDRPLEDQFMAVGKNIGRANETSPEIQAELEAESKWKKQKRLKYVESIETTSKLNIKPMLAYSLKDLKKPLVFPVHVQPKFNGVRCMAYPKSGGSIRLMSRGGKDYEVSRVQKELQGIIGEGARDGELYVHGTHLQTIRHLIDIDDDSVQYHVYDALGIPPGDETWESRYSRLCDWFVRNTKRMKHVHLAPTEIVHSMEEITQWHNRWVEEGYEGCIVRTMHGVYKLAHRSHDLLKVKNHMDAEFKIVGWCTGKDGVIKYTCVQEEGLEFEVRPVGTEAERAELLRTANSDIGKMLTVRFQERTEENKPFHGRGLGIRPAGDMG